MLKKMPLNRLKNLGALGLNAETKRYISIKKTMVNTDYRRGVNYKTRTDHSRGI